MSTDVTLLAVSGGMDSMVMLHWFVAEHGSHAVAVAHCNFQLRGEESDGDAAFVEVYCKENDIRLHSKAFSTAQYSAEKGLSIQEAARELRYIWFAALRAENGYRRIATAHHREDSTETFLINLMRGTGLDGLMGITEDSSRHLLRPILKWSKSDVETYAQEQGVKWREDSSNSSDKYLRNRVRHELMPLMDELRSGAVINVQTTISNLSQTRRLLKEGICLLLEKVSVQKGNELHYNLKRLSELKNSSQLLFEAHKAHGFSYTQIEDILNSTRSGALVQSASHELLKTTETIVFSPLKSKDNRRWTITLDNMPKDLPFALELSVVSELDKTDMGRSDCEYFDLESIDFPLTLRTWNQGDRMTPLGMNGSKLISDILTDEKQPSHEKKNSYLLEDQSRIIWLIGLRRDEKSKVKEANRQILRLRVEQ